MKNRCLTIVLIILIVMMSVPMVYGYKYEETTKRTFPISTAGTLRLNTLRGNIEISTHNDAEIEITAIIMSDNSSEIEKVNIKFETGNDSVTVSNDEKTGEIKARVDYRLKVPGGLKFVWLTSQSGEIKSRGKYGNIQFRAPNDEIDFRGSFTRCRLETGNGDIYAYVKGTLSGDLSAKSGNGDITVELKSRSDFKISGNTSTGSIRTDFRITTKTDVNGSRINGAINDGTHQLELDSINGDIVLLKQ
ncbi:MAG: DUF4097 domain-containing protein [bacterium]|nr:DUF4097 domain-containing protein [bacterium]